MEKIKTFFKNPLRSMKMVSIICLILTLFQLPNAISLFKIIKDSYNSMTTGIINNSYYMTIYLWRILIPMLELLVTVYFFNIHLSLKNNKTISKVTQYFIIFMLLLCGIIGLYFIVNYINNLSRLGYLFKFSDLINNGDLFDIVSKINASFYFLSIACILFFVWIKRKKNIKNAFIICISAIFLALFIFTQISYMVVAFSQYGLFTPISLLYDVCELLFLIIAVTYICYHNNVLNKKIIVDDAVYHTLNIN